MSTGGVPIEIYMRRWPSYLVICAWGTLLSVVAKKPITCIIWENRGNKKALMKFDTACHWISSLKRESHDDIIMATN